MIYFITDGEYLKIGTTDNLKLRFKNIQSSNPKELRIVATLNGDYTEETKLHHKFNNIRNRGEWFYYTEKLKNYITNLDSMDDTVQNTICEINTFNTIDNTSKKSFVHRYEIDLIGSYIKFNDEKTLLEFSLPFKFLNSNHYIINY